MAEIVVATRREGPHEHVTKIKLDGGREVDAADAIRNIESGAEEYAMNGPNGHRVLFVKPCPDCGKHVLWA